jgi:hypothetical protein
MLHKTLIFRAKIITEITLLYFHAEHFLDHSKRTAYWYYLLTNTTTHTVDMNSQNLSLTHLNIVLQSSSWFSECMHCQLLPTQCCLDDIPYECGLQTVYTNTIYLMILSEDEMVPNNRMVKEW